MCVWGGGGASLKAIIFGWRSGRLVKLPHQRRGYVFVRIGHRKYHVKKEEKERGGGGIC